MNINMLLNQTKELVAQALNETDNLIKSSLNSDIALINQIGHHIVNSGGKRLRPLLVLLAAKALNYTGQMHVRLAVIIEFIHTATLLHDDVVDQSLLRRGSDTANALWGNNAAVLVGDFIYSRAFQLMVQCDDPRIMTLLADTTNRIAEGEVMQLMNRHNAQITQDDYLQVIGAKTAVLFAAATQLAGIITQQSDAVAGALHDYGHHLGLAFQIADDALDYATDNAQLGKNMGDDLADGKITLPLIYALQHGTHKQRQVITQAISQGQIAELATIQAALHDTQALGYCQSIAQQHIDAARQALIALDDSPYRRAMADLADFALARSY